MYSLPSISMEISLIDSGIVDLFENCMCTSNPCGLVLYAFTQNMTLVRAIERNDYKVLDNEAYTNLKMVIDDASVKGEE